MQVPIFPCIAPVRQSLDGGALSGAMGIEGFRAMPASRESTCISCGEELFVALTSRI